MANVEHVQPVIFAGENPNLTLYRPGGDQIVAAASYWRCVFSEEGEGNALIIWTDPDGSGLGGQAPHGIFADNAEMGRVVTDRFTQHFANYQNRGFAEMRPQAARFEQQANGRRSHRIVCTADATTIELTWRTVLDVSLLRARETLGGVEYDIVSVICPCGEASVVVNARGATGEVRLSEEKPGLPRSSCFLAFSETWVER